MSEVINLNDTTPAAPSGHVNAKWQKGSSSGTDPATGLPIYPVSANIAPFTGDSGSGGAPGAVPAPAAGDAAAGKFLKADGTFAVPPDTTGITQLTGDVTAGPGSGSQVATLASTAVTPGSYTNANLTVDAKGRITAASNGSTAPSGSAGGDLSGTYPNPTVAKVNGAAVPASATVMGSNSSRQLVAVSLPAALGVTIDGGGSSPATGSKGYLQVPYACTITGWTLLADQSGSAQITVKKSTYSGFPTTSSIVASAPPNLSSAQKNTSTTLTGWITAIGATDVLEFNLDSVTTCQRLTLEIQVTRN